MIPWLLDTEAASATVPVDVRDLSTAQHQHHHHAALGARMALV